jgi:hypothetical protein
LDITKGGNGEGIRVNKTSGSGNAATIIGTLEATTLVKTGGTSSQFLKADGSIDSNTYVTTDTTQIINGAKTFNSIIAGIGNGLGILQGIGINVPNIGISSINAISERFVFAVGLGSSNYKSFGFEASNLSLNTTIDYTLPNASGTIALTSDLGAYLPLTGGTLTGALNGTSASFTSSVTAGVFLTNGASGVAGQEAIRINNDNGYIGFFNSANSTRSGYLQGNTTDLTLTTSLSTPLILGTNNIPRLTLSSTGAATFSSSVTAVQASIGYTTAAPTNGMIVNGDVGIGTTDPEGNLQIQSSTLNKELLVLRNTNTTADASVPIFLTSTSTGSITNVSIENSDAGNLLFRTGATNVKGYGSERMRITSGGNIDIKLAGIPTSDPLIEGRLYRNSSGQLFISLGDIT